MPSTLPSTSYHPSSPSSPPWAAVEEILPRCPPHTLTPPPTPIPLLPEPPPTRRPYREMVVPRGCS